MSETLIALPEVITKLEEWSEKFDLASDLFKQAVQYLKHYGYILKDQPFNLAILIEAIKKFQELYGLFVDGVLNPKTLRLMSMPRCNMSDLPVLEARRSNAKWGKNNLTYYISGYDTDLSRQEWGKAIETAFRYWSEVTPLRFSEVSSSDKANFILGVGSGRKDNFDGPSGTLAWHELPPTVNFMGQLNGKFDSGELWNRDILLVNVACHEIGHGLGLEHSRVKSALMAAYYSRNIAKPQINDDIPRIQELYGKNTSPVPSPTPDPLPDDHQMTIILKGSVADGSIQILGHRIQKMG